MNIIQQIYKQCCKFSTFLIQLVLSEKNIFQKYKKNVEKTLKLWNKKLKYLICFVLYLFYFLNKFQENIDKKFEIGF